MTTREVAVLAGRGKTGRAVASALAQRGVGARALGREVEGDPAAALSGVSAAYLIAPNLHPDEAGYVERLLEAAEAAGVQRVVYHSVAAAYAPAMPHHLNKARAEDLLRRSGLAWTILQPCSYVQNFVPGLRGEPPRVRVPYDVDAPFGLVDLADVGEAAAAVLLDDTHVGATYELGGPALVSTSDVAAAAGAVLGREVPTESVSPDQWRRTAGANLDPREADWLAAMFAYYDAYGLPAGSLALRALLDREPADLRTTLTRELLADPA